jgi:5-bromo-4-chloroindolyl phosphate hydrolysis protein
LVVECFAKITDAVDQGTQMYIPADEAKPILKAGLTAEDHQIRENAERAREKLLRLGRFDYLDIE